MTTYYRLQGKAYGIRDVNGVLLTLDDDERDDYGNLIWKSPEKIWDGIVLAVHADGRAELLEARWTGAKYEQFVDGLSAEWPAEAIGATDVSDRIWDTFQSSAIHMLYGHGSDYSLALAQLLYLCAPTEANLKAVREITFCID